MKVRACILIYIFMCMYYMDANLCAHSQSGEFTLVYLSRQTLKGGYPVLISC